MTTLALIRHGVTAWNKEGRIQGRADIGLSPEGIAELRTLRAPAALDGATWLTSPLRRTRQTAELLHGTAAVEDRLIETNWGAWEGLSTTITNPRADRISARGQSGLDLRPPGGESPRDLQARLSPLFADLAQRGGAFVGITAALANAVVEACGAATVIAANTPLPGRLNPAVHLVELPPVRSPDDTYARLVDPVGNPPDDAFWANRARRIDDTLAAARADIIVTETFPFGRRKLSAELLHLIAAARTTGAKIVASLRDLPTAPTDARRLDECADRLRAHYDAVLVHGDPAVFGINEIWPGEVPVPMHSTGYVVEPAPPFTGERRGVVVSAGGGGDAVPLLRAAWAARQSGLYPDDHWTFVTGANAPASLYDELLATAGRGTTVLRSTPDLPQRIAQVRLAISRGGYNTVIETVAVGTPLVVVPHAPAGEPEQAIRAVRFAELCLVSHLAEAKLLPETLGYAAQHALDLPARADCPLAIDGAAMSAVHLAEIAGGS